MMRYQIGSASTVKREQGFLDVMAAEFPDITIVSSDQYGGATTESSYAKAENLLSRFPELNGIFTPNESTTFGMLRALQDGELAGKVRFIGFDSSVKLVEALGARHLDALVLQDPVRMGYLGVKTMVQHLAGEPVPPRVDTGVHLITPANMEQPAMRQLLRPDLEQWLAE